MRTLTLLIINFLVFFHASCATTAGEQSDKSKPAKKYHKKGNTPGDYIIPGVTGKSFSDDSMDIGIYSQGFIQGSAVYIEVTPKNHNTKFRIIKFNFNGMEIKLTTREWGAKAVFGINPETSPGIKKASIEYEYEGNKKSYSFDIKVSPANFEFYKTPLDLGEYSNVEKQMTPEVLAMIKEGTEKKKEAFSKSGPDMIKNGFSHPRDVHFVTSSFLSKRIYEQYRIKNGKKTGQSTKTRIHNGLDLRGDIGSPVFAIGDGEIVLADKLYYEGNFIVLYHGSRIFSYYMHMDRLAVKKGDKIKSGDLIGYVGSTGLSTGPHLHISLLMSGVQIHPLSPIGLPIKD